MSSGSPLTPRQVFVTLDAISRQRALTEAESLALERAVRQMEAAGGDREPLRPWLPHEDRALRLVLPLQRQRRGRPRAAELSPASVLAPILGRSRDAILKRMQRLEEERA